jgi:hypothetical protein
MEPMLSERRWFYWAWLTLICGFAALHALDLRADFPNHSPWYMDWAKYTDEGWYGNAAIRAHLSGNWYLPGDFNPAPAVPVWPFLEWVLFFFTGVTIEAARGLAVVLFFVNLLLSYTLLKTRGPRWMAMLALTMLVTSPFLYCFSRLAILEPLLTTLTLCALNLAIRLPGFRRPVWVSVGIGLLFTLMMLTKTTAVFLLPALAWAMILLLWERRKLAARCLGAAGGVFIVGYGAWMAAVFRTGLLADYEYLFFINKYVRPKEFYWPLISMWWSFHGGLWVDRILVPLAGLVVVAAALVWRSERGRKLLLDPVFGASLLAVAGYILFMTYQDNPQPRYFAVVSVFCFLIVAQGAGALFGVADSEGESQRRVGQIGRVGENWLGWAFIWLVTMAVGMNGAWTLNFAVHPEYTFVDAAERITRYIDQHPNGNRLLLSVSGDDITLITHLPAINDLFVAPTPAMTDLAGKLGYYRPGWYAAWNNIDKGAIEDLHTHYSVEQVASFRAFDNPDRDVLVLFKLHPLSGGRVYDPADQNLQIRFPEDKFDVPLQ